MDLARWFRLQPSDDKDSIKQQDVSKTHKEHPTTPRVVNQPRGHPTIIEVFQSQGCNSCPPANLLLLSRMAQEDPDLLILDYHVTYWDYLGWKDPFGIREADDYQRQYAHARGTSRVYTPQVIVNGLVEGVGNSVKGLDRLIQQGEREASQQLWLSFSETEDGILVSETAHSSTGREGRVIEILYDPAPHDIYISRGENTGRTLTQRNTVRSVKQLGLWSSGQGPLTIPRRKTLDGLRRVLMVQGGMGGPIIGVSHIS